MVTWLRKVRPIFIPQVEHEAAHADGRIRAGDKILAINGQDMSNASQNSVVRTLQVSVLTAVASHHNLTTLSLPRESQEGDSYQ